MPLVARAAEWPVVSPAEAGFAPDLADRLRAGLAAGSFGDIHGVVVARDGRIVLEHYGSGADESWGRPLGTVAFGPDVLHDLRSVTKSVVGLIYGIARDRGLVPPPEAPLVAEFPEYPDLAADPARASITVGDALNMTMGTDWDEVSRPYTDPRNSEIAMEMAPDRLRFVLGGRVVGTPGRAWIYSGGAVALIGALIARGTGKTLPEFAQEALFAPLGITRFEWAVGSDKVASAASGLRLGPRDLLRIGQLVLDGGAAGGTQIVSRAWLDGMARPAVTALDGLGYARLWYLGEAGGPAFGAAARWLAGFGNGGQRLWVMPRADLVMVVFAGAYNRPDAWIGPTRIWREIVLANLQHL